MTHSERLWQTQKETQECPTETSQAAGSSGAFVSSLASRTETVCTAVLGCSLGLCLSLREALGFSLRIGKAPAALGSKSVRSRELWLIL